MARQRITIKHLDQLATRINLVTDSPKTYADTQPDGRFKSNPGHYHISQAYGGYALHRVHNEGGAITTPIGGGHMPARELYERMLAYLSGLEDSAHKKTK